MKQSLTLVCLTVVATIYVTRIDNIVGVNITCQWINVIYNLELFQPHWKETGVSRNNVNYAYFSGWFIACQTLMTFAIVTMFATMGLFPMAGKDSDNTRMLNITVFATLFTSKLQMFH